MKKAYTKPVIEGEIFAANEYVAACYLVTCVGTGNHGSTYVKRDKAPRYDVADGDGDGFSLLAVRPFTGYNGTINGARGEFSNNHPCVVESAAGTSHPNASV